MNNYHTFIELDENKIKDAWIQEITPKDISNAICISVNRTSDIILGGVVNPKLKDNLGCYLFIYEDGLIRGLSNEEYLYEVHHIKYNVYAIPNEDGFVEYIITDKDKTRIIPENAVFVKRTFGDYNKVLREYSVRDENEFYNYKIVDNQMVLIPLQEKIESVKQSKILYLSDTCILKIREGFSIGKDHYSLSNEDQINIQSLYITASRDGTPLLYHADGQIMRDYSKEEVFELFDKMEEVKISNLKLFNYLKATINESDDAEYINNMQFSVDYLSDKYKELMK